MSHYDWDQILADCADAVRKGDADPTFSALAEMLGMPESSLRMGFKRNFNLASEDITNLPALVPEGETEEVETDDSKIKITRNDNEMLIDFRMANIKTLDEMLQACEVDLDIWEVDHYIINKWPAYRRNEQADIHWNADGQIVNSTKTDGGDLTIRALFQVKVWLRRTKPIQPEIVIKPLEINVTFPTAVEKKKSVYRAVIIPDIHIGFQRDIYENSLFEFHDRLAIDVALQIVQEVNPDVVVYLGDILDLPEWSDRFIRSPDMYWMTQPAIIEAFWWLAQFKNASPNAQHILLNGNHEDRINRALITHLKHAYNLRPADELDSPPELSLSRLLCLDKLGIEIIEEYPEEYWINDDIKVVHGTTAKNVPGSTARGIIDNSNVNVIQGHIHKIELVTKSIRSRSHNKVIFGFIPGCLCKIDGSVPGSKLRNGWQQGLGIVEYNDDFANPVPVYISRGEAMFDGNLVKGRERLADLRKDTKWEQF